MTLSFTRWTLMALPTGRVEGKWKRNMMLTYNWVSLSRKFYCRQKFDWDHLTSLCSNFPLSEVKHTPILSSFSKDTINGILDDLNILERRGRPGAAELTRLLKNLQLKSLLDTHDNIAKAKMQVKTDGLMVLRRFTVETHYTGPKSNGNPPIMNAKLWSLQILSFYILYWW